MKTFHSFRRDKELSGRNGAIIFMEEWLYEKQIDGIFLALVLVACGSSGSLELSKQEKEKNKWRCQCCKTNFSSKSYLKRSKYWKIEWWWQI